MQTSNRFFMMNEGAGLACPVLSCKEKASIHAYPAEYVGTTRHVF
ncbi:hypothetical protein SAMN05421663_106209 [Terribacillus halophilus]|uniref:Uncharacterized protein n=1 Tax=Terribacillus halophilus TaxID=361279 RepID=A0A1G6RUX2_9BACI|nr:hypothetical protein SAMN05421663_106209 [Terribacillus halophilus]